MAPPPAAALALVDHADNDPVWLAARNAPPCPADEMPAPDVLASFDALVAEYQAGRARTTGRDEILATIEEMRRDDGE